MPANLDILVGRTGTLCRVIPIDRVEPIALEHVGSENGYAPPE